MIPLWLKIAHTLFVCLLVPIYWRQYGPANFLWFSDIALLVLVPALWLESPLLVSMMALAVVLPELAWNVDFFFRLAGVPLIGLADYMFDASIPRYIRGLSLFHVPLPWILIWLLYRLGYDRRALVGQAVVAALVLPLSYLFSNARENVNWVYGLGTEPEARLPAPLLVLVVLLAFCLGIYLPMHLLFDRIFAPSIPE